MEGPRVAIFISSVVLSLRERMTTTKNECNSKALWTPTPFHGLWLLLLLCVMKPQRKGFDSNRSQEPAVRLKGERGCPWSLTSCGPVTEVKDYSHKRNYL